MVYDTEYAYELLDKDYKSLRYDNYDKFKDYIEKDKNYIEKSIIKKYEINEYANYKEYICLDYYNNYYIFKQTDSMDYTVLLDKYTVESEKDIEDYNNQKNKTKVQLNLNKFMQMINRKDFISAYNVLNEDFRNKYFLTVQDFEQYILNNFYTYNEFEYLECSEKDNIYKVKTQINNLTQETNSENEIIKRFKVELKQDREFNISFDI